MQKLKLVLVFFSLWFCFGASAGNNDLKTANRVIGSVSRHFAPDKRTALFDLVLRENSGQLILKGKTNLPEAKRILLDSLSLLGISYRDSLLVLPSRSLGEKTWALVTLSVANLRSGPDHATELLSQAIMGTPLKVLEIEENWYRVQTPDFYLGWMEGNGLECFTEAEMNRWKKSDRYMFNRITGNAFESAKRKSGVITDLVLGDLFEVEAEVKGFFKIRTPDGRTGFVKKNECLSWTEWTSRKPDVQAVIAVARQLLGVPYLWGGTSCKSVDCSGMTKTAYFSQAIVLARDASQQARYGQIPDFTAMKNLETGDLLFFGRNAQHITHVGLYMENGRYIHASGMVRINSIDPNDPAYNLNDRKQLVSVSRILNSINTEGIVPVKDHPWYK